MVGVAVLMMTASIRAIGNLVEECVDDRIGGKMTQFLCMFGIEAVTTIIEVAIISGGVNPFSRDTCAEFYIS